jgi:hypothetical protein
MLCGTLTDGATIQLQLIGGADLLTHRCGSAIDGYAASAYPVLRLPA